MIVTQISKVLRFFVFSLVLDLESSLSQPGAILSFLKLLEVFMLTTYNTLPNGLTQSTTISHFDIIAFQNLPAGPS